ncbi:MAG: signal peptidase I [Chloroflexaceae bacterium]|nr:signal peptidase I [Chloroflexaceae bacterium]
MAQANDGGGWFSNLFTFAFYVGVVVGQWKLFEKAGEAGWKALIPIYNFFILLKIVGRPGWWLLLLLIPLVNLVILFLISNDTAKSFGKGIAYAFGLFLLGIIFYPLLGFSDAKYVGPAAA